MSVLFFSALLLLYSIYIVTNIIIPYYNVIIALNSPLLWDKFVLLFKDITGYNIYTEHILNKFMMAGFGGYISMGIICALLDSVLPTNYKTQGNRSYFTVSEWFQATSVSLFNLFFSSWVVTIPYAVIWKPNNILHEDDPFSIGKEVFNFIICVAVVDIWFYVTHYALHQPLLYSSIHKFHHRFKAPVAVASMYAHPIEFIVGNLAGVILGPLLTGCHPITAYVWIFNALLTTGGSHGGYKMFNADFHDAHHQYFDYNYGVDPIIDNLMGTSWEGSEKWKKLQSRSR